MQVHVYGMVLFHDVAEFGRDALWQRPGNSRADPDEFQVGNRSKRFQHPFEQMVREQERIASRENYIPHLRVLAEVLNGSVQVTLFQESRFPHQSLPGAKPAIDRALIRHHEQHPIRIAVNEVRHRTHEIFFKGIVVGRDIVQLCCIRDDLLPDRIILRFDCLEDGGGDSHGIGADDGFDLFFIEAEPVGQVLGFYNALCQDLSPVFHELSFVDQRIRQDGCSSSWSNTSGVVRA